MLPVRCILNGLKSVKLPKELTDLDSLSTQLIQLVKCFQTVVQLRLYS